MTLSGHFGYRRYGLYLVRRTGADIERLGQNAL